MTKGGRGEREPAERLPVARVCVEVPLAHLDRPFDYLVAAADDEAAQPGVRVKVRFAGQLVSGFLLERAESSPHGGKLAYLDKVVSAERVLDPEVARLARAVADRYAGNLSDVLRLAVPPRHARVESQTAALPTAEPKSATPEVLAPATTAPEVTASGVTASGVIVPEVIVPEVIVPGTAATDAVAAETTPDVSASGAAASPSNAPGTAGPRLAVPEDGSPTSAAAHAVTADTSSSTPAFGSAGPRLALPEDGSLGSAAASAVTADATSSTSAPVTAAPRLAVPEDGSPGSVAARAVTTDATSSTSAFGSATPRSALAAKGASGAAVPENPATGTAAPETAVPEDFSAGAAGSGSAVPEDFSAGAAGSGSAVPKNLLAGPAASRSAVPENPSAGTAGPGTVVKGSTAAEGVKATVMAVAAAGDSIVRASGEPTDGLSGGEDANLESAIEAERAAGLSLRGSTSDDGMRPQPSSAGAADGTDVPGETRGGWGSYPAGSAYLRALEEGRPARAVWSALPGEDWPARIAEAAAATVRGGRGVVIVVADARDLDRMDRALTTALGEGRHVALNAAAGPSERYRRFLAASRHQVPVVAGTRAAMFAPVARLGLVVIWDDGDDLHAEPRAPYPHARDVLLTRAQLADCAALVAGFARTGEGQLLLETGWAREITADRALLRERAPHIAPTGDDPQLARDPGAATARLPSLAWQAARQSLKDGHPVLVQVPRRGYLPSVACAECRTPARCPHCSGPLGLAGQRAVPTCHWCGRAAADYACPACGNQRLRASVTGARRTAEELGRAFAGVPIRTSGRDEILDTVPGDPAVVVATPGAEPRAEGGYGAVLLLDTWALLSRSDLRAAEETMRRWLNAAALARPAGKVVVVADGSLAPVQALLRWEPGWFAARELAERRELRFPPAARMASLTGRPEAVAELLDAARLPEGAEILGPVPADDDQERMLVRVSRGKAAEMAHALHEAAAVRSAKKSALPVRLQIDPADLF